MNYKKLQTVLFAFILIVQTICQSKSDFESFDSKLRIDQLPNSLDAGHSSNQTYSGSFKPKVIINNITNTFSTFNLPNNSANQLNQSLQTNRSFDNAYNLTALFTSTDNFDSNKSAIKNNDSNVITGSSNQPTNVPNSSSSLSSLSLSSLSSSSSSTTALVTSSGSCQPISIPMCKGIGYNLTRMPNQLNQDTQEEAGLEVHQFWPLVEIKCSEDLRLFLCSMYVPLCIEDYTDYIPVCRSVCERARKGCEPVMAQYRFSWPDRMNCDQLPIFGGNTLCMDERLQNGHLSFDEQFARTLDSDADDDDNESAQVPAPPASSSTSGTNKPVGGGQVAGTMFDLFGDKEPIESNEHDTIKSIASYTTTTTTTRPTSNRKTNRKHSHHRPASTSGSTHRKSNSNLHWKSNNFTLSLIHHGMNSPFDRLPDLTPSNNKCKCKCRPPFLNVKATKLFDRNSMKHLSTGNVQNCAFPCHSPFFSKTEQQNAHFWITCFSTVCSLCTLLTLATFISDPGRFRYPERCIIFMSGCYLMVSLGYLLRHLVGHEDVACDKIMDLESPLNLIRYRNTGPISFNCLLIFLSLYFFGMAASLWWVMLTLTWYLTAAFKWSSEAIQSYSHYFHLIVWFVSAIKSILIISNGFVEGDPFTGVCYVGNLTEDTLIIFVIIPLCIYLFFGSFFLLNGFISLIRIRSALRQHNRGKAVKFEKLMLRILVFSVLYIVPGVVVITCHFYDLFNREEWAAAHNCACDNYSNLNSNDVIATRYDQPSINPNNKPLYFVFLLKYIMCLGVGITSGFWIFSRKTIRSWIRFYGRCCCCCCTNLCEQDSHKHNNGSNNSNIHHNNIRAQSQMLRQGTGTSVTAALMAQPAASMGSHQAMGSLSMGTTGQSGSQIMSSASQLGPARSYKQLLQQQQFSQQHHQQQQQQFATNLGLVGFGSNSTPRTGSNSGSSISHAKLPLSHV